MENEEKIIEKLLNKEIKHIQEVYFNESQKDILEKAIELNMPILLVGETGTGKTSMVRYLAEDRDIKLYRLNLTGQTGVDEILGKWIVEDGTMRWIDGILIKAMRDGEWIVLDEINACLPEILFSLHSLLDDDRKITLKEKNGEIVVPHDNFRFFATMNESEDYAGTKELNKAFISRFGVKLIVEYSPLEDKIISERTTLSEEVAKRLVLAAKSVRQEKAKETLYYTCSTRDLIDCAKLLSSGVSVREAITSSIINKAEPESREKIIKIFELVTGDKIVIPSSKTSEIFNFNSVQDISDSFGKLRNENIELQRKISELNDRMSKMVEKDS